VKTPLALHFSLHSPPSPPAARCAPLSAQDVDGWRPREHIAWMFNDGDEMFHDLIRTQLLLPYVKGDFYEGHLSGATGGKFFALEEPNDSVRPIIIGSTWRGHQPPSP